MEYNRCRFCKRENLPLFKYGVRHYAHAECGILRFGFQEFLDKIPSHVIGKIPYRICIRYGYGLEDMEKYVTAREVMLPRAVTLHQCPK